MIDLLFQVGYILVVLAVISLFVCTIPIWSSCFCCGDPGHFRSKQMTLVIKKGEERWLIYKVRESTRTRLCIAPLKTLEEARAIAVPGLLACDEVTRISYET